MAATWTVIGILAASQAATLAVFINIAHGLGHRIDALGTRIDDLRDC
jgi:hypothetical protein